MHKLWEYIGDTLVVTVGLLVVLVLGMAFAVGAGHLAITKILPKLKVLLKSVIKDEEALNALMFILLIYIGLFVLVKVMDLLKAFQIPFINDMVTIIQPGVDIMLSLLPYLQWLVLGTLIILGLKSFRK